MPHFPKTLAVYSTIGIELALSVLLGLWAGHWLDEKFSTNGGFTLGGFLIGAIAGFRSIYRAAVKMQRETAAEEEERRNNPPSDR